MIGLLGVERVTTMKYINKTFGMVSHNTLIDEVMIHGQDKRTTVRKIGSDCDQQYKAEVVA